MSEFHCGRNSARGVEAFNAHEARLKRASNERARIRGDMVFRDPNRDVCISRMIDNH
jgi:hypothetical protein